MRISEKEKTAIVSIIKSVDADARIFLFGSRADDAKQGGDIDLLIQSQIITDEIKRRIKIKLYDAIGEQKIDMVISSDFSDTFSQIAIKQGAEL
jgi:predicted nucleotidyltransferase